MVDDPSAWLRKHDTAVSFAYVMSWVQGRCPQCAAEPVLAAYVELNLVQVVFQHSPDCPVAELLDDR